MSPVRKIDRSRRGDGRTPKQPPPPPKPANHLSYSSSEDDDDNVAIATLTARRRNGRTTPRQGSQNNRPKKKKSQRATRTHRDETSHDDDDDDSSQSSDHDDDNCSNDDNDVDVAQQHPPGRRLPRKRFNTPPPVPQENDDDDEEKEKDETTPKKQRRTKSNDEDEEEFVPDQDSSSSEEEEELEDEDYYYDAGVEKIRTAAARRTKPQRRSPRTKKVVQERDKKNDVAIDSSPEEHDDKEEDDDAHQHTKAKRRRRKHNDDDDDEEFVPDQNDNTASDEEDFIVGDDDEIQYSNVGSVGTAIESSESDSNQVPPRASLSFSRSRQRPAPQKSGPDSDDEEEEEEFEDHTTTVTATPSSPQKLACNCPSKEDAITFERLPAKHVCFFLPSGDRQCFALKTLREIALVAGHPKFRVQLSGQEQITFLQPPHFRTAMEDDLLDQIASRFGRGALDLNGPYWYYSRVSEQPEQQGEQEHLQDENDDDLSYYDRNDPDRFLEQIGEYLGRAMGSQDLCVCPICYTVAHKRCHASMNTALYNNDDDDDDDDEAFARSYPLEYKTDPMYTLGSLNSAEDDYQIASLFCFRTIAQAKEHLRTDHGVDTKMVDGSDLYMRYKIRAPDGLLQRYLAGGQCIYHKTSPASYWYHNAHNSDYVYLLNLVRRAETNRRCLPSPSKRGRLKKDHSDDDSDNGDNDDSEKQRARDCLSPGVRYFESFSKITDKLWNLISNPFRKYDDDLDDFIQNDQDQEEDEGEEATRERHRAMALHRSIEDEDSMDEAQRLAAYYVQRAKEEKREHRRAISQRLSREDETASTEENEADDDELVEVGSHGNDLQDTEGDDEGGEEEEEEEDEWDLKQRQRRGSIGLSTSGRKNRQERPAPTGDDSASKKRRVIHDSDDSE